MVFIEFISLKSPFSFAGEGFLLFSLTTFRVIIRLDCIEGNHNIQGLVECRVLVDFFAHRWESEGQAAPED